ncbi:MAG: prolyl oligopeptidase family serine peptidase [Verrucomicrobia bacterium]|nr:prolyl oligopeptidase family serine peptidase [Verrucomicrobiota bacterium]
MKSRTIILLAVVSLILPGTIMAQKKLASKPQDKFLTPHVFEYRTNHNATLNYLTFLPKGYQADDKKKWPLLLFLHGAGERGTNVWAVNIHGPSKYIAENPDFPFILVAPQCPANETWSNEPLLALLSHVEKSYRVDKRRVYLTGMSMGGYGAWNLGTTYPERFAAIAPICGGGQTIQVILAAKGYAPQKQKSLSTLGVWAFHGAKDTLVPPSESEHMLQALQEAKVKEIKYTVYPEAKHDSWTDTYNNPELYDWFLQHKR